MALKELPDGRWIVYGRKGFFPDDKEKTREYFGRGDDAKRLAQNRDRLLTPTATKATSLLVVDLCKAYREEKKSQNEDSTICAGWYKLKLIVEALGTIEASKLSERDLKDYVTKRAKAGKKNTTISRELADLKAIFSWAKSKKHLLINPIADFQLPKLDNEVIIPPTDDEISRLIAAASPHIVRAIYISTFTGLRPGEQELLFIRWHQVDFEKRIITIISAKKGGRKSRQVPLHQLLFEKLLQWKQQDNADGHDYIIHYSKDPRLKGVPVHSIKTAWKKTKQRAGITRRLRPYDFRHSFASRVLESGGDLKAVSEILGHSRPDTTMRVYQHVTTAVQRSSIDKINLVIHEKPVLPKDDE